MNYLHKLCCGVMSMTFISCGFMDVHPYPVRDSYRYFSRTFGERRTPESVEEWLDADADFGRIYVVGNVALFGVCKDPIASNRMKYAQLYLRIYKKILHRQYGYLEDVAFEDDTGLHYRRTGSKRMVSLETASIIYDFDGVNASANGAGAKRNPELAWLHNELEKLDAFTMRPR